ncbi:LppU/SCO3897 family protein [Nocardia seriolae]|uniref:Toxin-antitoxin system, toxin component n=1 Tax=Nocardia seriolae TaxID=37332 RepID=A0ABC8B036_9NOCA|nr:hypothetical protein [Nocardia seriolae]APA99562.1 hypothetical protein NS506_05516 [Nocardia seriolae]MTJ63058.1 hypothetical protein [Nocardia seriolae]MTJ73291.1 hypothetical protein [Nocardia seriolae]MTJ89135.1 hypothetical protein [Nocardia seriolae]MTK33113.1 hypothetical protein [Nocardia seriolae]
MSTPQSPFGATQSAPAPNQFGQANGVYCRFCGATPAIDLDFRAHRGMVFVMQYRKLPGPYCRDCGLASFRKMTGDSLVQGWWGPFSFLIANPITLLANLVNRLRVGQLPPPIPGAHSLPMDPGKPLWQRASIVGALVPLGLIVALIAAAASGSSTKSSSSRPYYSPPTTYSMPVIPSMPSLPVVPTTPAVRDAKSARVGDCVHDKNGDIATDDHPKLEVVDCGDARAQATVLGKPTGPTADTQCDSQYPNADVVITHKTSIGNGPEIEDFALCLQLK